MIMAKYKDVTVKQREANSLQQSQYYRQQQLIEQWQRQIGITNISHIGTKQLRDKSKQLSIASWKKANKQKRQAQRQRQRQKRDLKKMLRKQRQDQVFNSGQANNVGCNIVVNDPLGQTE